MHNFQNDLQSLEMNSYQVHGELNPISYSDDPRVFGVGGIGGVSGIGGIGGCWWFSSLWRF